MSRAMDVGYNFDDAGDAHRNFGNLIADFQRERIAMRNAYASVTSSWTGTAQQSFDSHQQKWDALFYRYIDMIEQMNGVLNTQTSAGEPVRNQAEQLL